MDPKASKGIDAEERLALRDLILMVREDEIGAAAVDIDLPTEIGRAHRRAFDVPAGSPRPPRRLPARLARFGSFPEREVEWVLFPLVDLDARAGQQIIKIAVRQLAVTLERANSKVDVAVYRVGMSLVDETLHHGDDGNDLFCHITPGRRKRSVPSSPWCRFSSTRDMPTR